MKVSVAALLAAASSCLSPTDAYFVPTRNAVSITRRVTQSPSSSSTTPTMFLDGPSKKQVKVPDTTMLGSLEVPTVGVGTISWSNDSLTELENLELQSLMNTACRSNAAFFDTAERYGSNLKTALGLGWGETEALTRKLLSRVPEAQQTSSSNDDESNTTLRPVIATKFTPSPWRTTAQSVVDACEESCKRLGVESLDLYQIHMPDIVQPFKFMQNSKFSRAKDQVYWEGMVECYNRGFVKNIGVCNYGQTLLLQAKEYMEKKGGVPLASNQIAYSLVGRHNGAQETLDLCNELEIKVLAFFPFAMGLLTGKYTSDASVMAKDTLTSLVRNKKTALEIRDLERYVTGDAKAGIPMGGVRPLLQAMEEIAQDRQKTVAQVALNYIIWKGAIPIPGARTAAQVRDNIGAMGWRLTLREINMLETAADKLGFGFEGAGFKRTSEKFVGYGVEKWTLD